MGLGYKQSLPREGSRSLDSAGVEALVLAGGFVEIGLDESAGPVLAEMRIR